MIAPVPHDIPLPLPAAEWFLKTLLVLSFIAHILFVNLMVGSSILSLYYEIKGLKDTKYDIIARKISETVTVNKSIAVVLGVAPLLLINVLYTVWFYAANSLTGIAWIMVIPSVTIAFLLTYLHQYTWDKLQSPNKRLHIAINGMAVFLFLCIPFIFLVNINLMLFPDRWMLVKGFFSALMLPNVFPRYLHFLGACVATTGLFLVWVFRDRDKIPDGLIASHSRPDLLRQFYKWTFHITCIQFLVGPLVLFTLPSIGLSIRLYFLIFVGVMFAICGLVLIFREMYASDEDVGKNVIKIGVIIGATVIFMASGRHAYRDQALKGHRQQVEAKTQEYQLKVKEAQSIKE